MKTFRTNFDLLFELSGMDGPMFTKKLGATRSQLSMWRSGVRKVVRRGHWALDIARLFILNDSRLSRPFLSDFLSDVYPPGEGDMTQRLVSYLTADGQDGQGQREKRTALYIRYAALLAGKDTAAPAPAPKAADDSVVVGYYESRQVISNFVDYMVTLDKPTHITFVCPDGIDIITKDEVFGMDILSRLVAMLMKGHILDVVLRTDFKLSEVSAFSGPWLVAHLMGLMKSWYYDDFRMIETDHIIICVEDVFTIRVSGAEYRCETFRDAPTMLKLQKACQGYKKQSRQHFHYGLFPQPGGFLQGLRIPDDAPCYLFQRLPHFSIGGEGLPGRLGLNEVETGRMLEQFRPLFHSPEAFPRDTPVYHMFCMDDIEDALDKPRHMHSELQAMSGRRVYMDTQALVSQLVEIQRLAESHKNYSPCFLPASAFEKIKMEIGVWGKALVIGWLPGRQSTATKEYATVAALHGFCSTVWSRIPKIAKSSAAANRALAKLLNRAKKMGYVVE